MKREGFIFYQSFWKGTEHLPEENQKNALVMIVNYGINGIEPDKSKEGFDYIAYSIFSMAKPQIDANNNRFENGKRGGRPKEKNQIITKPKPNYNQTETKPKAKENVNIKEKEKEKEKENIKEKNITDIIKTDEPSPVKKQNREDLLLIFEIVKNANGGISDDSGDNTWFIAGHLLNKLKKIDVVASGKYTRDEYLEGLLIFAKQNKYVVNYTTSLEKIYYNLAKLREGANSIALEHKKPDSYVFE